MFRFLRSTLSPPPAEAWFEPLAAPPVIHVPATVSADDAPPDWLAAGTPVAAGQPLTNAVSETAPPPIAPLPGLVGQPAVARLCDGRRVHAIDVKTRSAIDGPDTAALNNPDLPATASESILSAKPADLGDWLSRLSRLGVFADRWGSPDLLGQLRQALRRPVDTVVCNLLDSDPWLALSHGVAVSWPRELAAGVGLMARLTGATHTWALVDQAEPKQTFDTLRQTAAELAPDLRIAPIENDYPQPDPTLLVYASTRRRLRPGRLPSEQGVLLLDAAAAVAVGRAALLDQPQTRVPVVIYDQPDDAVRSLAVYPGTTVGAVLDHLGIPAAVREIFAGSPLRQRRAEREDVLGPAGELTLFAAPPQPVLLAEPCIRCGWCVEGCPTRCRPAGLLEAAQRDDMEQARRDGIDACIECGLCTYVCPSRLPILEGIRMLRR